MIKNNHWSSFISFILWNILIGKAINTVDKIAGKNKKLFSLLLKISKNARFRVIKLKIYQE